jgi:pimeloyl-ACP methyl ester carboxylesterase
MKKFALLDFNQQLIRSIAKISMGFAEIGECLAVAERIEDGNLASWYREWLQVADRLVMQAEECLIQGHQVSARDLFFRASEYYRQAFFFHREDLNCEELQACWPKHTESFKRGAALLPYLYESVEIPFKGKILHAYLFFSRTTGHPCPCLVAPSGYDGTAEEMLPFIGLSALERGYHVLLVDAPGQGRTLYDPNVRLHMRPDFETPLRTILDFVCARPEADSEKIALYGMSLGGYLATRGAAFEKRLSALIADPGQYDLGAAVKTLLPASLLEKLEEDSPESDALFNQSLSSLEGRIKLLPRMAANGATTVREFFSQTMQFVITKEQLGQIRCPSLICDNEVDKISTGQGEQLFQLLSCPKQFIRFTREEGAGEHCQMLGRQIFLQRALDWLDETLRQ